MYMAREIERTIDRMLKQGKVVLVTGARQVGKTTVLREHLGSTSGALVGRRAGRATPACRARSGAGS